MRFSLLALRLLLRVVVSLALIVLSPFLFPLLQLTLPEYIQALVVVNYGTGDFFQLAFKDTVTEFILFKFHHIFNLLF